MLHQLILQGQVQAMRLDELGVLGLLLPQAPYREGQQSKGASGALEGRGPTLVMLNADGAWTATLEDGTRVSASTLRRVACDCGLLAVGHDGQISPESLSRRKRATEAARINGDLEAHYRPKPQTYAVSPPRRVA
ncbi:MAG: hypothetical protein JXB06_03350 [Spirochaetales bacterium]|nr:hypothetical protein [Spirochaetales bacterium]